MTLTITHTPTDGTLVEGTTRTDGTAAILKSHGWRWSPNLGAWYLRNSRDRAPHTTLINRTADALRTAGHDAVITIDPTTRPARDVEADRTRRADERAAALAAKAERVTARATAAAARSEQADARLPDNGQPILIGHHSERGHRRAIERADNARRASITADVDAREAARRAEVAAHATDARYAPVTVANRIERLTSEERHLERRRGAHPSLQLDADLERLGDELAFWREVREEQIRSGQASAYGPHNVSEGDAVQIRGRWYEVVRANRKTVAVPSTFGSWTDTTPWYEVRDHRPAAAAD